MAAPRWHRPPRPDPSVIRALEEALEAARLGRVRAVVVVVKNPVHEVETAIAGDLGGLTPVVLIGGLAKAAHELLLLE